MTKKITYGVISDIHNNPGNVPSTIETLKNLGVEKLLINGDIANQQQTLQYSQNNVAFVLNAIGESGLESYVQPGSHESLLAFGPVMDAFAEKYSNLIDTTKTQKAEQLGHELIFLPGTDFSCGGEYQIGNNEQLPSGRYIQTQKGLIQFSDFGQYVNALQQGIAQGAMQYFNMNDLRDLVTDPDKSIVVCHVPRKFNDLETAVDVADFGEAQKDFHLQGNYVKKESVFPLPLAQQLVQAGYPVKLKSENRGNKDLQSLYQELGITKAVSGHFHESGHRAHDSNGNYVSEEELVTDLFWNSGALDLGQTGFLIVDDGKVSYRNVLLR